MKSLLLQLSNSLIITLFTISTVFSFDYDLLIFEDVVWINENMLCIHRHAHIIHTSGKQANVLIMKGIVENWEIRE